MRAGLIGAVLLSALAVVPRTLPAHVAPTEPAPSGLIEVDELGEVRERLERRRALQRSLRARVDALATEIEALGAQGERTAAVLQSEREQARALEQRLDRLVPRLLAREAEVDERRVQAARVLAELAGRSRTLRLAPTMRARMLALGPVMLERLRSIEHRVLSLRGDCERITKSQEKIEQSLADLTAAQQRVQRERAQKRLAQQAAANRLRTVNVEVRLLNEEQTRLARRLVPDDAAMVARAEPPAEQHALADLGAARGMPRRGGAVDNGWPFGPQPCGAGIARTRAWSQQGPDRAARRV